MHTKGLCLLHANFNMADSRCAEENQSECRYFLFRSQFGLFMKFLPSFEDSKSRQVRPTGLHILVHVTCKLSLKMQFLCFCWEQRAGIVSACIDSRL